MRKRWRAEEKREVVEVTSVMDPEPGRCRRTDGRKWRCAKDVIPLQKYCQRHMHRGRQGSRKHVEPILTTDHTRMPADVDTRLSPILKCGNDEARGVEYGRSSCACSRACLFKSSFDGNPVDLLSSRKLNFVGSSYAAFDSCSRYGLSPKSVLNAAGKVGLGSGRTSAVEPEPQRCRRTDGKKWQCRRDALHSQKYCEAHMHRGAKRVVVKPEHSGHPLSTPTIDINLDSRINLNIVPESPQRGTSNNSCSSTSDATTITD